MGDGLRVYDPIRVSYDEESLRMNDGVMVMNDKIEDVIIKSSDKLMNKYYQKPTIKFNLPTQEQSNSSCCPPTMTGNSNPTMTGNSNPNLIPALLENTKGSNNILESIGKNKTSGFANSTNIKK